MMSESVDDANSYVSCSICLDLVADNKDRSIAKLQCGHQFHLDCIGSAFNMKGAMQCPNCRKIESGRWLYGNGSARLQSDFGIDDWTFSEDPFELSYTEMPYGVHWCPFSGLTGVHSSFEEVDNPSTTYPEIQGNRAIFAEHVPAVSLAHSHVAYVRPIPRAISNSSEAVDDPMFSHRRNGQSGQNEIYNPNSALNVQYQSWSHHSPPISANRSHINGADQASVPPTLRFARVEADASSRPQPFAHPFLYGHGSLPRGRSSFVATTNHPGSNTRPHERIQASHVGHHPQGNPANLLSPIMPGVRRFIGPRGLPLMMPALPHADHHGGFYIFPPGSSAQNLHEAENPLQWERDHLSRFPFISFGRDSSWGSLRHASGGTDSNHRPGNLWRQWS